MNQDKHLPTWKSFFINIMFFFGLPILTYFIFDASGFTQFILEFFPVEEEDLWSSSISQTSRFVNLVFGHGVTHIFACASLHFLFNAVNDLRCLLFHKHKN